MKELAIVLVWLFANMAALVILAGTTGNLIFDILLKVVATGVVIADVAFAWHVEEKYNKNNKDGE